MCSVQNQYLTLCALCPLLVVALGTLWDTAEVQGAYDGGAEAARLGDIVVYNSTVTNAGTTTITGLVFQNTNVRFYQREAGHIDICTFRCTTYYRCVPPLN